MAENRQQATQARMLAHRFKEERSRRMEIARKFFKRSSIEESSGREISVGKTRWSYRDDLVAENSSESSSSTESGSTDLFSTILVIIGFMVAAVAGAGFIGNSAREQIADIATQADQQGSSAVTSEDTAAQNTSAERPSTQSDTTELPAESPAPADLTWVWTGLGIAGGGAGVVLLSTLSVGAIKRSRRASLEYSHALAARAEDKRRALAVWKRYQDAHQALRAKTLEIETDWDMIFKYPALMDGSVPTTRDFHRALKAADGASVEPPAELNISMAIGEFHYPQLVTAADESWDAAWSFAQRTGTKLIPREERKKIDQIVKLLRLARDGGGSEHERAVAYERATRLMGELHFVRVPEVALRAISAESRPMIEGPEQVGTPELNQPVGLAR